MTEPAYGSMAHLMVASYFADPPKTDEIRIPDIWKKAAGRFEEGRRGRKVLACWIKDTPFKWDGNVGLLVHSRTGQTMLRTPQPSRRNEPQIVRGERGEALVHCHENTVDTMHVPKVLPALLRPAGWPANTSEPPPKPRPFSPRDVDTHPGEYFTAEMRQEIVQRAGQVLVDLCAIVDLMPHERQLKPKLATRMRELGEREIYSLENYGRRLNEQMKHLLKADMQTEFDNNDLGWKERQRHYLRTQFFFMQLVDRGFADAYEHVMSQYAMGEKEMGRLRGKNQQSREYVPIKLRGRPWKKVESDRLKAEKTRMAMADLLPPVEFARWVKSLNRVEARTEGIDTHDEGLTDRMLRGQRIKEDFEHQSDGVHRGDMPEEYGADDYDWGFEDR